VFVETATSPVDGDSRRVTRGASRYRDGQLVLHSQISEEFSVQTETVVVGGAEEVRDHASFRSVFVEKVSHYGVLTHVLTPSCPEFLKLWGLGVHQDPKVARGEIHLGVFGLISVDDTSDQFEDVAWELFDRRDRIDFG